MAKKDRDDFELTLVQNDPVVPVEQAAVDVPLRAEPRVSFDVWFLCADRSAASMNQPHHKVGMRQFASLDGKKTKAEWDRIFSAY